MARVLIVSLSSFVSDPRVMRQYEALSQEHEVYVLAYGACPPGVRHFTQVSQIKLSLGVLGLNALRLSLKRFDQYYWNHPQIQALMHAAVSLAGLSFDVVLANDVMTLPATFRLARGAPVWLDAHEYAPREFEDILSWRLLLGPFFEATCRRDLPRLAQMTTVCKGIANEYEVRYQIPVSVCLNCPEPVTLPVRPTQDGSIRMIHHGAAIPSRKIEVMIELMQFLDERFSLDLMLVSQDSNYLAKLQAMASRDMRINFIPAVPMREIVSKICQYDIGLFLLPPTNFNYLHALPNKFFEFMQARLAIAVGPSPEMADLVRVHQCGVVSPSFQAHDMAQCLNELTTASIDAMKRQSDLASRQFNAAVTRESIRAHLASVLKSQPQIQIACAH